MAKRALTTTELAGCSITYNYATLSASHISELQAFIDKLDRDGKLSSHATYREYIDSARYALPEDFPDGESVIAFSLYVKLMKATFHLDGQAHEVLVPPQYYGLGLPQDAIVTVIKNEILPEPGHRLERLPHGYLKLLAVRSGLASYGRNNITYVDGMGSFLMHAAYVTDAKLPDEWTDLRLMPACENCRVCLECCPTGAIREEEFVIDAAKCIPLYNEVEGDFPDWLPADVHNAYIGCMRCQLPCPANREAVADAGRLPEITEQESLAILGESDSEDALVSAGEKLRIDLTDAETRAIIARNIRALLRPE
jgi:epoxyqueuosine reductase